MNMEVPTPHSVPGWPPARRALKVIPGLYNHLSLVPVGRIATVFDAIGIPDRKDYLLGSATLNLGITEVCLLVLKS